MTTKPEIAEFSLDDFASADTAEMTVMVGGRPTNWVWTFAGPGHPQTIEQSNRLARERLHQSREIEQTRLNGKKVKLPEETPDAIRTRNIDGVLDRLLGWSPVKIDGKDYPFTRESARALLADPRRVGLFAQALEFLADDGAFTPRSATT